MAPHLARAPPRLNCPVRVCVRVRMSVPFFQNDDLLPVNPKTKRLTAGTIDGDMRGMAAGFMWTLAGCQVQRDGRNPATATGDGVIERIELVRMLLNAPMVDELAAELVAAGLWHAPGHDCDRCKPVEPGTWLFHDWFDMKYSPGQTVALNTAKAKELKVAAIVNAVWARDCTDASNPYLANCRYCGNPVKRKDTVSQRRPELDHVDPTKAVGARNIVVSCNTCNRHKGSRTPEQAGMQLLPPPRPEPEPTTDAGLGDGPASPRDDAGRPATGSSRRPAPPSHGEALRPADPNSSDLSAARELTVDVSGPERPATAPAVDQPVRMRRTEPQGSRGAPQPDQRPTTPDQSAGQPGRAVPGGHAPGQGLGQGLGRGLGKGELSGFPQPPAPGESRSQRRRRRRRGQSPSGGSRSLIDQPTTETPESNSPPRAANPLDAGAPPPDVPVIEGFGSPYFDWHGPPSTVTDTDCTTHRLPMPCRKCATDLADQGDPA